MHEVLLSQMTGSPFYHVSFESRQNPLKTRETGILKTAPENPEIAHCFTYPNHWLWWLRLPSSPFPTQAVTKNNLAAEPHP